MLIVKGPVFAKASAGGEKSIVTTLVLLSLLAGLFLLPVSGYAQTSNSESANYIIKLKSGASLPHLENSKQLFSFSSNSQFQNIYSFTSKENLQELQKDLNGYYEYIEPNGNLATKDNEVFLNDPGFTSNPQNIDKQWGLAKAGFNKVWSTTLGSFSNVVAVIDTGIDATHEDLQKLHLVSGYNAITHQSIQGNINSDDNGHGTLVSGILGASANNSTGIVGTNWAITIMPIKALDSNGKGDVSAISESIVWAADHGANLINLSVGGIGFGHDTTLANAISYAYNKNVIIVAAAGNDVATTGGNLDVQAVYPICDDNGLNMVIGVAATDQNDAKPVFSNFGKNCIDVSAPGKRILSTINYDPATKAYAPNSYAYASGTSMAVPFVVGEAALIRTAFPTLTNAQVRDRIMSTADSIDNLNPIECGGSSCAGLLGAGRINAKKALDANITIQTVIEGDLIKTLDSSVIYELVGGQKRIVSSFVLNQRFAGVTPKIISAAQLANYSSGPFSLPKQGTLVKDSASATVFYIADGQKLPVLEKIFKQRKLDFSQINVISTEELSSWITGTFLTPSEGTMVRTTGNPTLYWVVGGVLHPINHQFYVDRGLSGFDVLTVTDADLVNFSKGEAYIR